MFWDNYTFAQKVMLVGVGICCLPCIACIYCYDELSNDKELSGQQNADDENGDMVG